MNIYNFFIKSLLLSCLIFGISFSQGKEVNLTAKEKKELNTFFSYFSEVFLDPFTKESITDKDLIIFALGHNYKNNYERFEKGDKPYNVKLKASFVDETVNKYFGRKIKKHQSIDPVRYVKGKYICPDNSSEEFSFSQIENLYDLGNNLFLANVNNFNADPAWTGDTHATLQEWKKKDEGVRVPEISEKMKATLQKVIENGKSRYILIDYQIVK
jgi:hypothetical protein